MKGKTPKTVNLFNVDHYAAKVYFNTIYSYYYA